MYKKFLNNSLFALVVITSILACNTPKPNSNVPETVVEKPKEITAEEEQAQERIGAASLDYSDVDESGNGIYGRQIDSGFYEKVKAIKAEADPIHKGVLKIICCIDKSGSIMMARPDIDKTTMNDLDLQRKVGKVLIDERFESTTVGPDRQCGLVVVNF